PAPARCAVQGAATGVVGSIGIGAEAHEQLDGTCGVDVGDGRGVVTTRVDGTRAQSGSGHQRRDALVVGQLEQRAVFYQQLDGGQVVTLGGTQEGRGADAQHAVRAAVILQVAVGGAQFHLQVGVG